MIDQQSFIYTIPGYTPISSVNGIQFTRTLQVPAEMPIRELHMGWRTANVQWNDIAGAEIEVRLIRTNTTRQTLRFAFDPWQATSQSTPASCVPVFTVAEYDGASATSADFDPTRIQFLSGRPVPLAPDCLLWPLANDQSGPQPASVIVTAPLRFRGEIDRIDIEVGPLRGGGAWKPALIDVLTLGNFTFVCGCVSKAV